mmetsp:Transcript_3746/g.11249  ORF Transcript_3746/g.11249 Transcript_3746/m.11249 type:complete len:212 (+) Transcript_3746:1784-2419(+)
MTLTHAVMSESLLGVATSSEMWISSTAHTWLPPRSTWSRSSSILLTWCGPITRSTSGTRLRSCSPSCVATQPATTTFRSVPSFCFLLACSPSAEYTLTSAFSRMLHVLYTSTFASFGSVEFEYPIFSSTPAMRSESAIFIWHPKVWMWYFPFSSLLLLLEFMSFVCFFSYTTPSAPQNIESSAPPPPGKPGFVDETGTLGTGLGAALRKTR